MGPFQLGFNFMGLINQLLGLGKFVTETPEEAHERGVAEERERRMRNQRRETDA